MSQIKVKFLGAAGTVTGSKYLVQYAKYNILVDCGVFQGPREWRVKNWNSFESVSGIAARDVDLVLLTHAHIDHSAYLPRLRREGMDGPIYATKPTVDLCSILLPDYGKIQEEDAQYRARKGYSRHQPPLALYTKQDAVDTMEHFVEVPLGETKELLSGVSATWTESGHILGACCINLTLGSKTITFSGDVGRYDIPILNDPKPVKLGDLLLIESTYGDRVHQQSSPKQELARIIKESVQRKGVLIIPSFAVGRAQLLLYYINELKHEDGIPDLPIIVDSPMAQDATRIYRDNSQYYDQDTLSKLGRGESPLRPSKSHFIQNRDESIKLNQINEPMVIISASGMVTGGRVVHHLLQRISSPMNTILFVGHQAAGTPGAWIKSGAKSVRLIKQEVTIRAKIEQIGGFSAHGDRDELLDWFRACKKEFGHTPEQIAVVHGEQDSAKAFADKLRQEGNSRVLIPRYLEEIVLDD